MGTQMATTGTDYGSLFRPKQRTQAQRDADAEASRRSGDYSSNTARRNNAPSAGDQSSRGSAYGTSAPKQFKARQKNMEYKEHTMSRIICSVMLETVSHVCWRVEDRIQQITPALLRTLNILMLILILVWEMAHWKIDRLNVHKEMDQIRGRAK